MCVNTNGCVFVISILQVIQWCTHHKDDPPPPEDDENKEKRTDDIPVWDQEFLKVDQGTLFELILVCFYYVFFKRFIKCFFVFLLGFLSEYSRA